MAYSFYYWGPLLCKIKVSKEDTNKIYALCKKNKTKDWRKKLAGAIDEEYLINTETYFKILHKYFLEFEEAFKNWYGLKIKEITAISAWVNFMKKGEYNPPHVHANCDLSSVLYIKVPEKLKEENNKYVGTSAGAGSIIFQYGETVLGAISEKKFFPEEGDLYIFPHTLRHYVVSFKSDIERVSVAANYKIFTYDK
jgi:uncharacterized protein (TIGR02466 family)